MMAQIFRRGIASESLIRQVVQVVVMLIAGIILMAGFGKIAELELTETQMFLGFAIVISLVLQCFTLWVLIELKSKTELSHLYAVGFNPKAQRPKAAKTQRLIKE